MFVHLSGGRADPDRCLHKFEFAYAVVPHVLLRKNSFKFLSRLISLQLLILLQEMQVIAQESKTPKVLLLAGSTSNPSRSTRLLRYVGERLQAQGFDVDELPVVHLPAHALLHADFSDSDLKRARAQVAQADALVISTPVYKAAYSGVLKAFLDLLPQDGLAGKLVLTLATGGSQSHMLALDYALRPVLSSMSPHHILPSIYATDSQVSWSDDQGLVVDAEIEGRLTRGIEQLSTSLSALRDAAAREFAPVHFSQIQCSV